MAQDIFPKMESVPFLEMASLKPIAQIK